MQYVSLELANPCAAYNHCRHRCYDPLNDAQTGACPGSTNSTRPPCPHWPSRCYQRPTRGGLHHGSPACVAQP
jgi:hypothetical protein